MVSILDLFYLFHFGSKGLEYLKYFFTLTTKDFLIAFNGPILILYPCAIYLDTVLQSLSSATTAHYRS